jgi:hypothetical protein
MKPGPIGYWGKDVYEGCGMTWPGPDISENMP